MDTNETSNWLAGQPEIELVRRWLQRWRAGAVGKVSVVREREVAGHDCELGWPPREGGLAIVSDLLLIVDFEVL